MAPLMATAAATRALFLVFLTHAIAVSAVSYNSLGNLLVKRQATTNTTIPQPYVFPPSQFWEGNDGNWWDFR